MCESSTLTDTEQGSGKFFCRLGPVQVIWSKGRRLGPLPASAMNLTALLPQESGHGACGEMAMTALLGMSRDFFGVRDPVLAVHTL